VAGLSQIGDNPIPYADYEEIRSGKVQRQTDKIEPNPAKQPDRQNEHQVDEKKKA
jgi:hypothetical protein